MFSIRLGFSSEADNRTSAGPVRADCIFKSRSAVLQ
jgi:hypothetical protein